MTYEVAVLFPEASRRGGVERVAWDLLAHLAHRNRKTALIANVAPDGLPRGVAFLETNRPSRLPTALGPLWYRHNAAKVLRAVKPQVSVSLGAVAPPGDVLWVHSVHKAWLSIARPVPTKIGSVPPATRFVMPRHRVLLALEKSYFTKSNPRRIICTSAREVRDLVDMYGVDPVITTVIPDPFDPELFNVGRRTKHRDEAREVLGLDSQQIAVFFVGNELHRKGFLQLVHATARIKDERLTVHVIGRSAPDAYKAVIKRLGIADRIRYHGPTNDLGWLYAAADLLVLPTQYEPFGLVIVEALASGVPVITTSLAGAAEAVVDGQTGLIQRDPDDVDELVALIERAIRSDLRSWSTAAAASVERYERNSIMARVERVLLEADDAT